MSFSKLFTKTAQRVGVASMASATAFFVTDQLHEVTSLQTSDKSHHNPSSWSHYAAAFWRQHLGMSNMMSVAACDADPYAAPQVDGTEERPAEIRRQKTDFRKLEELDATRDDDDKTTFYGQCLLRQLYRPRLPYPAWDYDWDHRETAATSQQAMSSGKGFTESKRLAKTRHIILVRHGQYDERYKDDRRRKLTPLGRHQAELTGQRLALMARGGLGMMKREFAGPCHIKCIHVSDMERAKETASIIHSHLSHVKMNDPDPMLNEALPAPMIPIRPDIRAIREIDANHSRIEAAFQKYIHRSLPSTEEEFAEDAEHDENHNNAHEQQQQLQQSNNDQGDNHDYDEDHHHEFELIVGHGNIIRYFFCRALQLPPEAWLRISTFNCSITYLIIYPNGYVSCRMLGDVGHLGYDSTTFSGSHGYNW